jgi:hypothetical protein
MWVDKDDVAHLALGMFGYSIAQGVQKLALFLSLSLHCAF